MRIHNRNTIVTYGQAHPDAAEPLRAWFAEVEDSNWTGPNDVKIRYPSASILTNDRIVFNIKGNSYRLIVAVKYKFHVVYIRFIGTHAEYDRVDAATV